MLHRYWPGFFFPLALRRLDVIPLRVRMLAERGRRRVCPADTFVTTRNEAHNIFMSRGTTLHTIKFGKGSHKWTSTTEAKGRQRVVMTALDALTGAHGHAKLSKLRRGRPWRRKV